MGIKPYEQSVGTAGRRLPGMKLLKTTSRLRQYKLKGHTLFRPWGTVDSHGNMAPWRDNQGNFGASWFVQDAIAEGWGKDFRFTAFINCEDESNWKYGSPLLLFHDDMKSHPEYKHMFDRAEDAKTFSPLSSPKQAGFLKGLLIETGEKSYKDNPIWGTCLVMSSSAREAFEDLLAMPASNEGAAAATQGDPFGWNAKYMVGDPIGFATGKIFEFDKESKIEATEGININGAPTRSQRNRGPVELYGVRIWKDQPNMCFPLPVEKIMKFDEPFEDALLFMTGEEQINQLLIPGFGRTMKSALLYTFGGKGILPASFEHGKVTIDMAATAPAVVEKPAATSAATVAGINLGGDGGDVAVDETEAAAVQPATAPVQQPAATPVAPAAPAASGKSAADDLRARLAAARAGTK